MEYDFSGWATKNNIKCSDGRTIMRDAFKDNDGQKVPLVWNHQHNHPDEVLGHALLENRAEGVYAYCKFNDTESGQTAKKLVVNGDVDQLSIYANKLKSQANNVIHGCIREVSLVLAGANPGAFIDSVISHSEDGDDEEEGVIYTDENIEVETTKKESEEDTGVVETDEVVIDDPEESKESEESEKKDESEEDKTDSGNDESGEEVKHSDDKTIESVFNTLNEDQKKVVNTMTGIVSKGKSLDEQSDEFKTTVSNMMDSLNDEQKDVVYALVGSASEVKSSDSGKENKDNEGEDSNMKHNVFENEEKNDTLVHSEIIADALADAKKYGSMRESFIEHAAANNIENIDYLFPEAKEFNTPPVVIKDNEEWVGVIMNSVRRSPFSRVKTTFAKMDETTARAKGYIKGNMKANIALSLLKRITTPTTVYIKNTMDRDDVIDITDFDVVAWLKGEMRGQLNKELALAMLLGDGRDVSDDNKINEQNIRPIVSDDNLYTIKYEVKSGRDYKNTANSVSENDSLSKGIIRAAIKSRKDYKGSGKPTFFTTEDILTDLLLIEDQNGRIIYDSIEKLATAMRVSKIVTVPEMESRTDIYGVIVNFNDYTAGADKGGHVGMFDDFDIDYNQMKYLMETRMSGALTVPYSAIVLKKETTTSSGSSSGTTGGGETNQPQG